MKKLFTLLIAAALTVASLTSCAGMSRKSALDEIAKSYSVEDYYETQQREVEALVAEYTKKINASSDKDEMQTLQDECIEKIKDIYTKDGIEDSKKEAEVCLGLVKGKILPYQDTVEAMKNVKDLLSTENYDELRTAVDAMTALLDGNPESAVFHYKVEDTTFDVEASYSLNAEGLPVVTLKSSKEWNDIGFIDDASSMFELGLLPNTSLEGVSVERMLSCVAFEFSKNGANYLGEAWKGSKDPAEARCTFVDDKTIEVQVVTQEQWESFQSGAATYLNSDGEEINRDGGFKDAIDYIMILESDPSNSTENKTMADRVVWIVVL